MNIVRDSLGLGFVAATLLACGEEPEPPATTPSPAVEAAASTCGDIGHFEARISGALNASISWPDTALRCESMRRPDNRGVRLRFSGEVSGERLAVIIAMPELDAGETGAEFDCVVTVTVDGSGRFFSTPNLGACFVDIERNEPVADATGPHIVAGDLSCVGPLGEFNGDAYVDIQELRFSGIADWNAT